jgi:hypothetical protein
MFRPGSTQERKLARNFFCAFRRRQRLRSDHEIFNRGKAAQSLVLKLRTKTRHARQESRGNAR